MFRQLLQTFGDLDLVTLLKYKNNFALNFTELVAKKFSLIKIREKYFRNAIRKMHLSEIGSGETSKCCLFLKNGPTTPASFSFIFGLF